MNSYLTIHFFPLQKQLDFALSRLAKEDPSLKVRASEDTGQTILEGMGELHLEIIRDRIQKEYGVDADLGNSNISIEILFF